MPTDLECLVVTDEPYTLVRIAGTLDPPTAGSVRDTLLSCLVDQPGVLIVELSQLRVADPGALSVFAEIAEETADWPVGALLFHGLAADPAIDWDKIGVRFVDSVDAAVEQARTAAVGGPLHANLEPAIGAARRARELVTEGCCRWELPDLVGSGCIAVTEMVNNVVAHAQTPMVVRLALRTGALHIAVRDYCAAQPVFGGLVPPTSTGGRGLLLIDTVARRWGTGRLSDGKIVWAVLHPEDEPTP